MVIPGNQTCPAYENSLFLRVVKLIKPIRFIFGLFIHLIFPSSENGCRSKSVPDCPVFFFRIIYFLAIEGNNGKKENNYYNFQFSHPGQYLEVLLTVNRLSY
jgi:hypothetical protein